MARAPGACAGDVRQDRDSDPGWMRGQECCACFSATQTVAGARPRPASRDGERCDDLASRTGRIGPRTRRRSSSTVSRDGREKAAARCDRSTTSSAFRSSDPADRRRTVPPECDPECAGRLRETGGFPPTAYTRDTLFLRVDPATVPRSYGPTPRRSPTRRVTCAGQKFDTPESRATNALGVVDQCGTADVRTRRWRPTPRACRDDDRDRSHARS